MFRVSTYAGLRFAMARPDSGSGQVMLGVAYNLGSKHLMKEADEKRLTSKQPAAQRQPRLINVGSECGSDECLRRCSPLSSLEDSRAEAEERRAWTGTCLRVEKFLGESMYRNAFLS
ncbi:hypothetical protein E2C01_099520 [Portunus trituberculatus]|uniref:Uncharacterized protein n=1 Tax=Portunus trituberculatus TaxID=210409 RepID=A0A5B7KAZ4_PORTR|nr:hypothetical protein [Portunus trituberculatus]